MKTFILFLGILILLMKIPTVKNLFKSKETLIRGIKESNEKLEATYVESNIQPEIGGAIVVLIAWVIVLIYSLFYLLSSIFISQFAFTILSILLIITSFINGYKVLVTFNDFSKLKCEGFVLRLFNLLVDLFYIAFVFYQVYLSF